MRTLAALNHFYFSNGIRQFLTEGCCYTKVLYVRLIQDEKLPLFFCRHKIKTRTKSEICNIT